MTYTINAISYSFLALLLVRCFDLKDDFLNVPKIQQTDSVVINVSNYGSSRATGYSDSGKFIETDSTILFTWLGNDDDDFIVYVSSYNKLTRKVTQSIAIDKDVDDNHGGASMLLDSKGLIHIAYGPHASQMRYKQSLKPGDIASWSEVEFFGDRLTYPSMVIDSNDNLYLIARQSNWNDHWPLVFYQKSPDGNWHGGDELLNGFYKSWVDKGYAFSSGRTNGYTRYSKSFVLDSKQRMHLSFKVAEYLPESLSSLSQYENEMAFYVIGYMYSDDYGQTWLSQGQQVRIPASPSDVEVIDGSSDPLLSECHLEMGSMSVTTNGLPVVIYSRNYESNTELILAERNVEGDWNYTSLSESLNIGDKLPISPSGLSIDANGNAYVIFTLIDKDAYCLCTDTWGNQTNTVMVVRYSELSEIIYEYTSKEQTSPAWLPIASNTYNAVDPAFMFLSGGRAAGNDEKVANNVYFIAITD